MGCLWGRNQTNLLRQNQRGRCRMAHWNIYPRSETHCRLFDWIHGPSCQSTDRRPARHIFAEEKCQQRDHQSNTCLSTERSSPDVGVIEGGHHSSWPRIWMDKHLVWLPNRIRNHLWRNGKTHGDKMSKTTQVLKGTLLQLQWRRTYSQVLSKRTKPQQKTTIQVFQMWPRRTRCPRMPIITTRQQQDPGKGSKEVYK